MVFPQLKIVFTSLRTLIVIPLEGTPTTTTATATTTTGPAILYVCMATMRRQHCLAALHFVCASLLMFYLPDVARSFHTNHGWTTNNRIRPPLSPLYAEDLAGHDLPGHDWFVALNSMNTHDNGERPGLMLGWDWWDHPLDRERDPPSVGKRLKEGATGQEPNKATSPYVSPYPWDR
jgi:hypothetical protein